MQNRHAALPGAAAVRQVCMTRGCTMRACKQHVINWAAPNAPACCQHLFANSLRVPCGLSCPPDHSPPRTGPMDHHAPGCCYSMEGHPVPAVINVSSPCTRDPARPHTRLHPGGRGYATTPGSTPPRPRALAAAWWPTLHPAPTNAPAPCNPPHTRLDPDGRGYATIREWGSPAMERHMEVFTKRYVQVGGPQLHGRMEAGA